jgi:hypothetical protein
MLVRSKSTHSWLLSDLAWWDSNHCCPGPKGHSNPIQNSLGLRVTDFATVAL